MIVETKQPFFYGVVSPGGISTISRGLGLRAPSLRTYVPNGDVAIYLSKQVAQDPEQ
jgi:hypothetical protein